MSIRGRLRDDTQLAATRSSLRRVEHPDAGEVGLLRAGVGRQHGKGYETGGD